MKRLVAALALAVGAALAITGCTPTPEKVAVTAETVVIDVRTPEEYASGHLENAVNVNVQSSNFDAIMMSQPIDGDYLVYCRSGNRSAQATARMEQLGFTNVTDLGSVQSASQSTGIPIVQ